MAASNPRTSLKASFKNPEGTEMASTLFKMGLMNIPYF
jgi:hypothetical protein